MSTADCFHEWRSMIAVDEHGCTKYGSIGSMIGYACIKCGVQDVRWPGGIYETGASHDAALALQMKRPN